MSAAYWIILLCGALALVYGAYAIRSVTSVSAGNERMQEIATAIQEGANAYLNRQYTTIAVVIFRGRNLPRFSFNKKPLLIKRGFLLRLRNIRIPCDFGTSNGMIDPSTIYK